MPTNPFADLIGTDFKNTFKYAIQAVIDSFAIPCRIVYPSTKFEACDCAASDIGNISSNRHITGAPVPFHSIGPCSICGGSGKKPKETTENVDLAVVFDYKQFIKIGDIVIPDGVVQIISPKSLLPKLIKAREIVIDTDNEALMKQRFVLYGQPVSSGFDKDFIISFWKRS